MNTPKIVLLAGKGTSTNVLYHALKNDFNIDAIILEKPMGRGTFIKKRIKKLGAWNVFGQILFQLVIVNSLNIFSSGRKKKILEQYRLDTDRLPAEKIIFVNSVNDDTCLQNLKQLDPDLVVVNGTRIIAPHILGSVPSKFINMHAGITPKYRGVHGVYWALVNNDPQNCGVTVHLVDNGIDTGAIISQKTITVTSKDNFVTYPLLQLAEGIPLMKKAIDDILSDRLVLRPATGASRLWHHPTIWQYLRPKK